MLKKKHCLQKVIIILTGILRHQTMALVLSVADLPWTTFSVPCCIEWDKDQISQVSLGFFYHSCWRNPKAVWDFAISVRTFVSSDPTTMDKLHWNQNVMLANFPISGYFHSKQTFLWYVMRGKDYRHAKICVLHHSLVED